MTDNLQMPLIYLVGGVTFTVLVCIGVFATIAKAVSREVDRVEMDAWKKTAVVYRPKERAK